MANKVTELKQALGPGARANKYRLHFHIPQAVPQTADLSTWDTLAVSSSFPEKTIGTIIASNQGRDLRLPGDTSFPETWEVTLYNTEGHDLRRAILEWMRSTDHFQDNMHSGVPNEVMTTMAVSQLDSAMNETVRYTFHNVWPSSVGSIELSDETKDTIQQFTVTFTFSDWVVGDGELDKPLQFNSPTKNWIA